ncbi:hypothetical protein chiPu_0023953, partial [Chiloscyllium punctatum]|nr:hypothetical protein [Chiloscyllium punctatum]
MREKDRVGERQTLDERVKETQRGCEREGEREMEQESDRPVKERLGAREKEG